MLPGRLSRSLAALGGVLLLSACAWIDGTERGAIRENVIEPGITAINESRAEACGINASTLRTALEVYELLIGEPAPDEAALVTEGFLNEQTDDWNIVDGRLVAENPACGEVPTTVPTAEIVTEPADAILDVDEVMAAFSDDQIASFGGPVCARQLAVVFAGAERFVAELGVDPESFADVEAAGLFAEPVTLWQVIDDVVRPAESSPCLDFVAQQQLDE